MEKKKIMILLPDGVGLRNFAYTKFHELGVQKGYDVTFWNNTPFDLASLGLKSIDIKHSKVHFLTEVFKNARKEIELNLFRKKFDDLVYETYRFPMATSTLKKKIKSFSTKLVVEFNNSNAGLINVRKKIKKLERLTPYYSKCLETLQQEKPSIIFCTNQRALTAVAAVLAARDLKFPTACFIFSWDNLPKATMVVEADYYFVWNDLMKTELLFYYPHVSSNRVFVTGTPQFENHFNRSGLLARDDFFALHNLDVTKKYICYSGDDVTTCPDDPQYLADVAKAVESLNEKGVSLGIIFRRCPVDFSNRFDEVLAKYKNIIVAINPIWEKIGEGWNTILPKPEDMDLQLNTIAHTEMVINLGSSMVFDYAAHRKPCAYINYDVQNKVLDSWSVTKIYKYVHFRSMPNDAVIWLNSKDEVVDKILLGIESKDKNVAAAQKWFEIIAGATPDKSSSKIWEAINKIID